MEFVTLNNGVKMPLEALVCSRCRTLRFVSRQFPMPSPQAIG